MIFCEKLFSVTNIVGCRRKVVPTTHLFKYQHVYLLGTTWNTLFLTRQVFEGGEGLRLACVDDDDMREGRLGIRLPIGGLLQVECLVQRVVALLAVGITHLPVVPVDSLAMFVLGIEFGNGRLPLAILIFTDLKCNVTSTQGFLEANRLPGFKVVERAIFSFPCGRAFFGSLFLTDFSKFSLSMTG